MEFYINTTIQDSDKTYNFSVSGKYSDYEEADSVAKSMCIILEKSIGVSGATYSITKYSEREVDFSVTGC